MKIDNFYKAKLKNGLTVLFEKRNLPVVSIVLGNKFGSGYESESEKGIAHLIEHMAFKGTKTRSQKEIASEIEKKGGILNAFTAEELTAFWCKLPSKYLGFGINILSDLATNPLFLKEEIEKEKKVIIEEIKMYHDDPMRHSINKIKPLLYQKPFGISGTGTKESVEKMTRERVARKFCSEYASDKIVVAVVGNADFEQICEFFGKIPAKKSEIKNLKIKEISKEIVEKRKDIDQAHFILGWHSSSLQDKERYASLIFSAILSSGMSSRLFQEIREKRGLAYAINGEGDMGKNYGYETVYVGTTKDKVREVREIILKEIKNMAKLERGDFEEAKEQVLGLKQIISEDSSIVATQLLIEEIAGHAEEYYKFEDKINSVKLEEVKKLKLKSYSSFSLVPG